MIFTKRALGIGLLMALTACEPSTPRWNLLLAHSSTGDISEGSIDTLISAIRSGCSLRVAWGARRASDPGRTIEHIADPVWVSVRNSQSVEVQLEDFVINLSVLGEPVADHANRERFGGVSKVVKWRAILKTDGTFDAVWFAPHSGEFIERIPQRHPMRWYADCQPTSSVPLYPLN